MALLPRQTREEKLAYKARYYREHRAEIRLNQLKWYRENKEHVVAKRHAEREYHAEKTKAWREQNVERATFQRKKGSWKNKYGLNEDAIDSMLVKQNNECVTCGIPLIFNTSSLDRIQAETRGGLNVIENFQLLCLPCNLSKRAMSMEEFIEMAKRIAKRHRNTRF